MSSSLSRLSHKNAPATLLIHFGFWASALIIAGMGWTLYDAATRANVSSAWVAHTHEVLQSLGNINAELARAESAQRGYLLSASDRFQSERDQALGKLTENVTRVATLTSDNAVQQGRVPKLEEFITERIALMQENARRRQTERIDSTRLRSASGVGQQASARIYDLTSEMEQEERRLLELRRTKELRDNERELLLLFLAVLVSVIVLIPGYIGFVLQTRARERAERKLLDMTDALPGAIYQWRTLTDGTHHFEFLSRGVERLRGVNRDAALRNFSAMWESILEEDRPAVAAYMASALRNLTPVEYEFRVKQVDVTFSVPAGSGATVRYSKPVGVTCTESSIWIPHLPVI